MLYCSLLWVAASSWVEPLKNIRIYNVADGLVQSQVRAMVQTPDGLLWIGTGAGVSVFDGYRFNTYARSDGLARNDVWSMALGRQGEIWFGHSDGSLSVYRNGRFEAIEPPAGLPNRVVNQLTCDERGRVWVVNGVNGQLTCYLPSEKRWAFLPFPYGACQAIQASPGALWLMTDQVLVRHDSDVDLAVWGNFQTVFSGSELTAFWVSSDGRIWLGTVLGRLFQATSPEDNWGERLGTSGTTIQFIQEQGPGTLLVATDGAGAFKLGPDDQMERFNTENGLSHNVVESLLVDRDQNAWIGTSNGLSLVRPSLFQFVQFKGDVGWRTIWCFWQDANGTIWVGTDSGAIRMEPKGSGWTYKRLGDANRFATESVRGIVRDGSGQLWTAIHDVGLVLWDHDSPTVFDQEDGLSSNEVVNLHLAQDGNLWVGTRQNGIMCVRPEAGSLQVLQRIQLDPSAYETVFPIYEDAQSVMWWGARHSGLVSYDPVTKKTRVFGSESGLQDLWVMGITAASNGGLWVSTQQGGIFHFDGERFFPIDCPESKSTVGYFIQEEQPGVVLVGTERGLLRYSVLAQSCQIYDQWDGFRGIETNVNAIKKLDVFWMGTIDGIALYNPRPGFQFNGQPPRAVIQKVEVAGAPVSAMPSRLGPSQNNFQFEFTAFCSTAQEKVRYRYRLKGLNQDWETDTTERVVRYTGLKPGAYEFQVQAKMSGGPWGPEIHSDAFKLLSPLWLRPWFIVLLLCALIASYIAQNQWAARRRIILETLIQTRTQDLQQRTQELEQSHTALESALREANTAKKAKQNFLAIMSHEIRTPINGILGMAEHLKDQAKNPDIAEQAEVIFRSTQTLLVILNDILDLTKIEAGQLRVHKTQFDLLPLLEETIQIFGPEAAKKGLVLQLLYDPNLPKQVFLDPDRVRQILLNLLNNALKFTDRGYVLLRAERVADDLKLCVEDSGIGIQANDMQKVFEPFTQLEQFQNRKWGGTGLGLSIVHQLTLLLDGEVKPVPLVNGTRFEILFPGLALEAHPNPHRLPERSYVQMSNPLEEKLLKEQLSRWQLRDSTLETAEWILTDDAGLYQPGLEDKLVFIANRGENLGDELGRSAIFRPISLRELWARISRTPLEEEDRNANPEPAWSHSHILVVDDNRINLRVAVQLLRGLPNLDVDQADSGADALYKFRSTRFDLVFMDCQMPEMDGFECTQRIRELDKPTVIVALTANALEGDNTECIARGMDDYLAKPIARKDLIRVLNRWLPSQSPHEGTEVL
ncbi:MAG: response regulator [Acidobacteria bacterium]|nr:response regulator [Acidobacteriota bacterium]MCB9399270.1 response regulator [Acidobacteriota bacterium]